MIVGIGVDLIEVDRVLKAVEKESFLKRCFTAPEIAFIVQDKKKAADNFAVKEAVAKMFGTGFRGFSPKEVEVLRDHIGKPYVILYGKALDLANEQGIDKIFVSITNTKDYSNAFVVGEAAR